MFHFSLKSDSKLQDDVTSEIKWDPSVSSDQVSATVTSGIVTLRGTVPHYAEKLSAEQAAQRVSGIRAVANEIEVNILGAFERTDQQIAEAALSVLEWDYSVPKDIKVSVEKGWITLTGETEWDFQRAGAKTAVSNLWGVCGVTNNIKIKSSTQPLDVKTRIEDAFKRTAESDATKIKVAINGSTATLTGNVHSLAESDDAKLAAWMAPGIISVENNLTISP